MDLRISIEFHVHISKVPVQLMIYDFGMMSLWSTILSKIYIKNRNYVKFLVILTSGCSVYGAVYVLVERTNTSSTNSSNSGSHVNV